VLTVTLIFKKSWSLWRQALLASRLLEQILGNNSGEVHSNWPIIFVQTPTTTHPEDIGGKHGRKPQQQSIISTKAFVGRLTEGELHHSCRMEHVLILSKNNYLWLIMLSKLLDFFVSTCFSLVDKLIMSQDFSLLNKIMYFPVFISHYFLLLLRVNNILSTTFAHKTTTRTILRCFPFFLNHT